ACTRAMGQSALCLGTGRAGTGTVVRSALRGAECLGWREAGGFDGWIQPGGRPGADRPGHSGRNVLNGSCRRPVAPAGVQGGGEGAEERAGGTAGKGMESGLRDELGGDVGRCGAESATKTYFATALEDGDDHDVGNADTADAQRAH